jgi:hypothetical protein
MAIILIEEVLMGLEEVKGSLEQAVLTLGSITEDMRPEMGDNLKGLLEQRLLLPLQSSMDTLDVLLEDVADMV